MKYMIFHIRLGKVSNAIYVLYIFKLTSLNLASEFQNYI